MRDDIGDGSTMLVGYARVGIDDQDLTLQRAALKEAGCRRLYEEKLSGSMTRSSPCGATGPARAARQPRTASLGSSWRMARVAAT